MNTKTLGKAERFGSWLGRAWRAYADCVRRVASWFVARGVPTGVAIALLWIVKLVVLAILFYVVFWLALLLLFVAAVALGIQHADGQSPQPESKWTDGPAGFGLYKDGYRIDPHVYDDD